MDELKIGDRVKPGPRLRMNLGRRIFGTVEATDGGEHETLYIVQWDALTLIPDPVFRGSYVASELSPVTLEDIGVTGPRADEPMRAFHAPSARIGVYPNPIETIKKRLDLLEESIREWQAQHSDLIQRAFRLIGEGASGAQATPAYKTAQDEYLSPRPTSQTPAQTPKMAPIYGDDPAWNDKDLAEGRLRIEYGPFGGALSTQQMERLAADIRRAMKPSPAKPAPDLVAEHEEGLAALGESIDVLRSMVERVELTASDALHTVQVNAEIGGEWRMAHDERLRSLDEHYHHRCVDLAQRIDQLEKSPALERLFQRVNALEDRMGASGAPAKPAQEVNFSAPPPMVTREAYDREVASWKTIQDLKEQALIEAERFRVALERIAHYPALAAASDVKVAMRKIAQEALGEG